MAVPNSRTRLNEAEHAFTLEWDRLSALHPAQVASWSILALIKRLFDIGKLRSEVKAQAQESC